MSVRLALVRSRTGWLPAGRVGLGGVNRLCRLVCCSLMPLALGRVASTTRPALLVGNRTKSLEALRGGHRVLSCSPLPLFMGMAARFLLALYVLPVWFAVASAEAGWPCCRHHFALLCCLLLVSVRQRVPVAVWVWAVLQLPAACVLAGACLPL